MKKTMLTSRLNRRLRALNISSFKDYYNYVTSPQGEEAELIFLINEVSTNKTDFFREPDHFQFMTSRILPQFTAASQLPKPFRVWSAGCSSGEEPYTIAMVLAEYQTSHPNFDYSIFATDISTKVLAIAEKGVYSDERLVTMKANYRIQYTLRGKGTSKGLHKIIPELRNKVHFRRLNFMDRDYNFTKLPFDLIFCRNVIIYFDRETQINLFHKLYQRLRPGSHIFIGHSETMPGMDDKMKRIAPAVYHDTSRRT